MVAPNSESVTFDIRLEAVLALQRLAELTNATTSFKKQLDIARLTIQQFAADAGISFSAAKAAISGLDKELSGVSTSSTVFGAQGQAAWNQVGNAAQNASNKAKKSSQSMVQGLSVIKIALGSLISMLVGSAISAITGFFSEAISQAKQYETTLYRLSNIERELSLGGVETSVESLLAGAKAIQELLPIFSKEDVKQLVGAVGVTTKELGYTENQILNLSAAIAILNVNSTATESLLQTQSRVTNSLLAEQGRTIGDLGLTFGKSALAAKGLEMGILKTGEAASDLTKEEKDLVKLQIVLDQAGIGTAKSLEEVAQAMKNAGLEGTEAFSAINRYLESNTGKVDANTAAWKDLQTTLGTLLLPFIPILTGVYKGLTDVLNLAKIAVIEFGAVLKTVAVVYKALFSGNLKTVDDFRNALSNALSLIRKDFANTFFQELPDNAPKWVKALYEGLLEGIPDTATGDSIPGQIAKESEEELKKAEEAFENFREKLDDLVTDFNRKREDLDIDFGRKSMDIGVEYSQKEADALKDYQRDLQDIETDTQEKIADIRRKNQEEEKKAEKDHLQDLKRLREDYLMDLEDALRARDARQVLRLMKQYALDKKRLQEDYKSEQQERRQAAEQELQDAILEAEKKRQQAELDYQRKLEDLATAKRREYEELEKWRRREEDDLRRDMSRRLADLVKEFMMDEQLTAQHLNNLLSMASNFAGQLGGTLGSVGSIDSSGSSPSATVNSIGSSAYGTGSVWQANSNFLPYSSRSGLAEGGTFLATRPTSINVAENRPEIISAMPLGKPGADINKIFSDMGAGGTGDNRMTLRVSLSEGLIADIVDSTMNSVSAHIEHVRRKA